jgi:2-oxoglutarate ferredoxin oxidoreductase subunit alpha
VTTTRAESELTVPVRTKPVEEISSAIVRFAGDSGDGMQLTGTQFTDATAIFGNDLATLPEKQMRAT